MNTPQVIVKEGSFDNDVAQQVNQNFANATLSLGLGQLSAIAASGAINPNVSQAYVITKSTAAAALTLAAPVAGAPIYNGQGQNIGGNDGVVISIFSNTAEAHTVTATGLLQTGSADVNEATFAAYAGASLVLQAYKGLWNVIASTQITFS
jgi:hypothetical protein